LVGYSISSSKSFITASNLVIDSSILSMLFVRLFVILVSSTTTGLWQDTKRSSKKSIAIFVRNLLHK